jgi:hypothetical protein
MTSLHKTPVMHSSHFGFQSKFAIVPVILLLLALWMLMYGYHGLTGDGQIYAFQALARLRPQLTADLYLQNTSQDQFTIFSPLYAWCIGLLGLSNAARLLTLVFTAWLLAATWSFVRAVTDRNTAWLAAAFLLIVAGDYGGSRVFQILDPVLTARLPAEALVATALACHARGMKRLSLVLAFGALFVHPLIALPGLLLVVCLWMPSRAWVVGAVGGIVTTLAIAIVATNLSVASHELNIMDAPWLDVVRERSQFLFLQLWSLRDWCINTQPFISLGFTAVATTDERIRRLCAAAALVGAAGLAVAFIGSLIGPVAILVQGQAWRWVWVAVFISVVLVPVTALRVWRDERCGPPCTLLFVLGWTLPDAYGLGCTTLALIFWLTRTQIGSRWAIQFRWISAGLGVAIGIWIFVKIGVILSSPTSGHPSSGVAQIQNLFELKIPAVLFGALTWWGIRDGQTPWMPALVSAMLVALSICIFPAAFEQARTPATSADIREFADWESVIPPTSTVLVTPPRDVGAFVWFVLARPNYLALDQSSGVVFSRTTALEVRRRSDVLLPLMDPEWKILTGLRTKSGGDRHNKTATRPLTAEKLVRVCTDPQVGFVISPEKVGFHPLRHLQDGAWKDWNLYDCREVRSTASAT